MKLFGFEIRAAQRSVAGPRVVGYGSRLGGWLQYGSTQRDWKADAGDLQSNSSLAIGLAAIAGKIGQTRLEVQQVTSEGQTVYVPDPAGLAAWMSPMPGLNETVINKALACSLALTGNGYALKRKSEQGLLLGFAPLYPFQVYPYSDYYPDGTPNDGNDLITRYQIMPYGGGSQFDAWPREMLHIRYGMVDQRNPALGLSPVLALLRQVVSENEANTYIAGLLANMGVPGVILIPKNPTGGQPEPTPEQKARTEAKWWSFTRDRRGMPLTLTQDFDVKTVGLSPTDLKAIETKIQLSTELLAAVGVDPMVVGLPSPSKTYDNVKEARESFMEDTILPILHTMAPAIQQAFIESGYALRKGSRLAYNTTVYRELADDVEADQKRARDNFEKGLTNRGEARRSLGLLTDLDDQRTYFDLQGGMMKDKVVRSRYTPEEHRKLELMQAGAPWPL